MKKLFAIISTLTISLTLFACVVVEPTNDVSTVIDAIEALPKIEDLTLGDEPQVISARALFEALDVSTQTEVTNLVKLESLEARLIQLKDVFQENGNIVEEAVAAGFSTLAAALTEANLVTALSGSNDYTVFAPTEAAFSKLLTALDTDAAGLLAHPFLSEILLYHVVEGSILASAVITLINEGSGSAEVNTLLGAPITLTLEGAFVKINGVATVETTDVLASNGVIHIIDTVLIPPNIVEIAVAAGFSTLAAAVIQEELVDTLSNTGPYTVFAPTDAAFTALISALNTDAAGLLEREDLTEILLYHVVDGKVLKAALAELISEGSGTAVVPTLLTGQSLTFTVEGSDVKINGTVTVSATDIVALNGVIHVIDGVLLPPPELVSYSISFVGFEGSDLGTVTYSPGDSLIFPTAQAIGGYTMDGWDNDGSNITSDVTITATYSKIFFTLSELSAFNGLNGADAYIAVNGVIYDVTGNVNWPNGSHNGYQAGQDLTNALSSSPHGIANVLRQPVVGFLS